MWGLIEDASEQDRFTVLCALWQCGEVHRTHVHTSEWFSTRAYGTLRTLLALLVHITHGCEVKWECIYKPSKVNVWDGLSGADGGNLSERKTNEVPFESEGVISEMSYPERWIREAETPQKTKEEEEEETEIIPTQLLLSHNQCTAQDTQHTHTHTKQIWSLGLHPQPHSVWECEYVCVCEHQGRLAFRVDGYLALLHASCWLGCRFQASVPDLGSRTPLPGCPLHPPCIWYALQNCATKDR